MKTRTFGRRLWNILSQNAYRFTSLYGYREISRWRRVRGKYGGERLFLIANGPSLNITPLYLLRDEYTIAFNRFGLMLERLNFVPDFYMVSDGEVGKDIKDDIFYFIEKSDMVFVPDIAKGDNVYFRKFMPRSDKVMYMFGIRSRYYSHSLPFVGDGNTVIFPAFQVAEYLGFKEIVVVGNDMNYVLHTNAETLKEEKIADHVNQTVRLEADDDPNHFDYRYFGKGRVCHQPTEYNIGKIFDNLDTVARNAGKRGVKIMNAGYNSKVTCFEKKDFFEVLGYSDEKISRMFGDLVAGFGYGSLEEFMKEATRRDGDWEEDISLVSVECHAAERIVKEKIEKYIPVGPYRGNLYFINRKTRLK